MSLKCPRCGRIVGITARGLKLKDSVICFKCFEELGFDKSDRELASLLLSYNDVKDGKAKYELRRYKDLAIKTAADSYTIEIKGGQEREINATDGEKEIYRIICYIVGDLEFEKTPLRFVRVSDNYLTAKYGEWDLARFKFTDRAKWILFATIESQNDKHKIEDPEDVFGFADLLKSSLEHIEKY